MTAEHHEKEDRDRQEAKGQQQRPAGEDHAQRAGPQQVNMGIFAWRANTGAFFSAGEQADRHERDQHRGGGAVQVEPERDGEVVALLDPVGEGPIGQREERERDDGATHPSP